MKLQSLGNAGELEVNAITRFVWSSTSPDFTRDQRQDPKRHCFSQGRRKRRGSRGGCLCQSGTLLTGTSQQPTQPKASQATQLQLMLSQMRRDMVKRQKQFENRYAEVWCRFNSLCIPALRKRHGKCPALPSSTGRKVLPFESGAAS